MDGLVEFLRAQLDEDERVARAADGESYWLDEGDATGDFLHHHDPARVLAEVAAKRRILELHESWPVLVETPPEFTTDTADLRSVSVSMSRRIMWLTQQEYRARFGVEPPPAPIVRLLALPYADRPGFRD